jgi:hypothetical protein
MPGHRLPQADVVWMARVGPPIGIAKVGARHSVGVRPTRDRRDRQRKFADARFEDALGSQHRNALALEDETILEQPPWQDVSVHFDLPLEPRKGRKPDSKIRRRRHGRSIPRATGRCPVTSDLRAETAGEERDDGRGNRRHDDHGG